MSQSFNLYQVQRIDTRIDLLISRNDQIKGELEDRAELQNAENLLQAAENHQFELLESIDKLDNEIQAKKIKVNQSEASLYGGKVQNPKELQSLQAEIDSLNKNILEKERMLTDLTSAYESSESEVSKRKIDLSNLVTEKNSHDRILSSEKESNIKELERLHSERNVAASQVQPRFMEVYEEIRKKRKNLAVTSIDDGTCSACGVSLTPSEVQSARSVTQITFCPSCSRILYAG